MRARRRPFLLRSLCDCGMSTRPGGQRASNSAPAKDGGGNLRLLFGVARAGLGRLRRLAVFDPAFVAQITTFLRFTLAFGRLAVLVHLFLDEPCTFLDLTLDAHVRLPFLRSPRSSVSGNTNVPRANLLLVGRVIYAVQAPDFTHIVRNNFVSRRGISARSKAASQILPQALEEWVAHLSVRRLGTVFDLGQ